MPESLWWPSSAWYLALALIGAGGILPAAVLTERLDSRGLFFARPVGLALVALTTWLAVRLTPLSYGTGAVLGSLAALLALSAALAWWRPRLVGELSARWRTFAVAEGLTLVVFVLVLLARVQAPDAWGTEKPSDLMLLTAVHRAEEFPPLDPWLSGERISYYHLGQVQVDHVARLSAVSPASAFNLATATAGAMAAAAAAGLAADLVRLGRPGRRGTVVLAGATAVVGLLLVAPPVGLVQVAAANGLGGEGLWGGLGVPGVPSEGGSETLVPSAFWWWWATTRVVPGVISEYPGFSLVLGDPHAHLLALPLGLVALALAVQVFQGATPLGWRRWLARPEQLVLTAAVFAALAMTNSWDVLTYGALWGIAAWWAAARAGWGPLTAGVIAVRWAALPTGLGLLLAWPFLETLDPQPLGVAAVIGESSDPGRWLLVWGAVFVPAAIGLVAFGRVAGWRSSRRHLVVAAAVAAGPVLLWGGWLVVEGQPGELVDRGWGWVTIAGLVLLTGWAAGRAATEPPGARAAATAHWLVAGAAGVLLLTELVHLDDAFPGRLNTAFKFWFHAWAIVAVAGGGLLALTVERARDRGWFARPRLNDPGQVFVGTVGCVMLAAWLLTMLTPPMAAVARAREGQEPALSAIAYLDRTHPSLGQAVAWGLAELDPERNVVVEAIGESYGPDSRFAAFTGIPTILGWPGHERQWRGDIQEEARRAAVAAIYTGSDEARREAIERWHVTHVLVGRQERATYGPEIDRHFAGWPVSLSTASLLVFEVPAAAVAREPGGR